MEYNKYYTSITLNDGFGSQYQKTIETFIYCKMHDLNFAYRNFKYVEHNYDNDKNYINKLENLINLKNNLLNVDDIENCNYVDYNTTVRPFFEKNIDICCESEHMKFIKECYWQNKNKDYYNNNKINVAIHIRRANLHDKGQAGERVTTPNIYYLNIMNKIREKYKNSNKEVLFHIYSQGKIDDFNDLEKCDVNFYINFDLIQSFIGMVSADILVISPSSLSYVAALISDGEIYYKPFWHNPRREWIVMS